MGGEFTKLASESNDARILPYLDILACADTSLQHVTVRCFFPFRRYNVINVVQCMSPTPPPSLTLHTQRCFSTSAILLLARLLPYPSMVVPNSLFLSLSLSLSLSLCLSSSKLSLLLLILPQYVWYPRPKTPFNSAV